MVPSTTRKIFSLAISLLVVVISLTGVALAASAPTVATLTSGPNGNGRYTPGFAGAPGKMARDAAGNFYVADFWGKGIVKLNRDLSKAGFIPTKGRPTAVAVLSDNRLVVAMSKPIAYVAFYSQTGVSPFVTGEEITATPFGSPAKPIFNPTGIAIDDSSPAPYIYVIDSGDNSFSLTENVGTVRVYESVAPYNEKYAFGTRTTPDVTKEDNKPSAGNLWGGYFKQPAGIVFEKAAGQIVVVDTLNGRLQFFSKYNGTSMTYDRSVGGTAGKTFVQGTPVTGAVRFFNPVDVAFEYDLSGLKYRMYVAERGKHEITVANAEVSGYGNYLRSINSTTPTGADLKLPSSVLFEKTGTVVGDGVLYTANAATTTPANILALSIGSGAIPAPGASAIAFSPAVPATSTTSLIVGGTTNPTGTVICKVNGAANGTVAYPAAGTWTTNPVNGGVALTLPTNQMNYIVCQTTSVAGVTAYAEASTYTGGLSAAPTVTIATPATGVYKNAATAAVTVSGTLTGSSIANATVQIASNQGGSVATTSDATGAYSAVLTLTGEGANLITVSAYKTGTNTGTNNVTVNYDKTVPDMTTNGAISFIAPAATTTSIVQNLDGLVYETNLQSITVNGVPVPAAAKIALTGAMAGKTYFSVPLVLERGTNIVTVVATDMAGNSTPWSRTVTLAPDKPGFTVALPVDNKWKTAVAPETASGTADTTYTSIDACGTAIPAVANWSTTTPSIGSGLVSCQFTASGGGNTTVNEKRTFNTSGSQIVAITAPAIDTAVKTATYGVTGSVTPGTATTPQIQVNSGAATNVTGYTIATGLFTANTVNLVPGVNVVKLISNGTTAIRNIIYDNTSPDVTIMADSKPMPKTISGSIDSNAKFTVVAKISGADVTIPASKVTFEPADQSGTVVWHVDLAGYLYDKITFTAIDPALNSAPLEYVVGIPTGDVDGDGVVRLTDALAALRHVAGTDTINPITDPIKFFNADVGGLVQGHAARDGVIDITDSKLILNKAYGLVSF